MTTSGPADAIVVMGAAQYDGRPSPVFAARLDHAVALYQAGRGAAPRRDRRQGRRRPDDRGGHRPGRTPSPGRAGRRDPRRGRAAGPPSSRSVRSASSCARTSWPTRSSSRTGRTCCGSCGWPRDDGHRGLGLADRDQPDRARPGRPARRHAPRARRARPVLPGRCGRPERSPRRPTACTSDFPLGEGGLAPYTVPKPADPSGPPRAPTTPHEPVPDSPLPSTERGSREAGRGSVVRRSHRLRA